MCAHTCYAGVSNGCAGGKLKAKAHNEQVDQPAGKSHLENGLSCSKSLFSDSPVSTPKSETLNFPSGPLALLLLTCSLNDFKYILHAFAELDEERV